MRGFLRDKAVGVLRDRLPADVPGALRRALRRPHAVEGRHDPGRRRLAHRRDAAGGARRPSRRPSTSPGATTSTPRSRRSSKGDADVAVEMQGDTLVAHYTQTDAGQGRDDPGRAPRLRRRHQRRAVGQAADLHACRPSGSRTTRLKTIQFVTPGLLGWAVAMSASFGAAATLNGWRSSKLLRRLQLAPVPTGTVVGARVTVTVGVALDADGDLPRPRGGGVRAAADRCLAGVDPAAGGRHAVLHGDRAAGGCRRQDHRGRGQHGQLHRAADGVPQRVVLPARRGARAGSRPWPTCCRCGGSTRGCST